MRKAIFAVLFVILYLPLRAKVPAVAVLLTMTDDKNPDSWPYPADYNVEIADSNGRVVWSTEKTAKTYRSSIWISTLATGHYTARYNNVLEARMEEPFDLAFGTDNKVVLNIRKFPAYTHNALARLKDGDRLMADVQMRGCFGFSLTQLIISRAGGQLTAGLYKVVWHEDSTYKVIRDGSELLRSVVMNDSMQSAFVRFENQLRYAVIEGCTTEYTIKIRGPHWKHTYKDGSCEWNGFDILVTEIFGDVEYLVG